VYTREVSWMLPWERLVWVSESDTQRILALKPDQPLRDVEGLTARSEHRHAEPPGSLQLVPREAFELTGGYDERFRGASGGDSSFFWAAETLYGRHVRGSAVLLALWHARLSTRAGRVWEGQTDANMHKPLENQYKEAWRDPREMRKIVAELREYRSAQ
jgi:hypothetical protein